MAEPRSGTQILIESLMVSLIRAMKLDPQIIMARIADATEKVNNANARFAEIERKQDLILKHLGVVDDGRQSAEPGNDENRHAESGGHSEAQHAGADVRGQATGNINGTKLN